MKLPFCCTGHFKSKYFFLAENSNFKFILFYKHGILFSKIVICLIVSVLFSSHSNIFRHHGYVKNSSNYGV